MSYCDGDLYKRLKAEGRLNLLFRLSEPCASWLKQNTPENRSNVIPFVSRTMRLRWREQWRRGRFVRLSWPSEERAAILRQDEIFRQADAEWERRHPKPVGPGTVLRFPAGTDYDFTAEALRTPP